MTEEKQFMSVKEACTYLGISRATLYNRIKDGRIKPTYPENSGLDRVPPRFNRADVLALVKPVKAAKPAARDKGQQDGQG